MTFLNQATGNKNNEEKKLYSFVQWKYGFSSRFKNNR